MKKFLDFLKFDVQKDVKDSELADVLSFLQGLVDARRADSTIRSHAAALRFFFELMQKHQMFATPVYRRFVKGAQRLAPIPKKKCEIWDIQIPLNFLKKCELPKKFLPSAREAVVLLLLATGWRIDDVFKLDEKVDFYESRMRLYFREKRKCPISGRWTDFQDVLYFPDDERLCPGRALRLFLRKGVQLREKALAEAIAAPKEENELFFLFCSSKGFRASKMSISRWVTDILKPAGLKVSAGSCRSAVASAAFERKVAVDDILRSAGWSSPSTFQKFYRRDVEKVKEGLNMLPPVA